MKDLVVYFSATGTTALVAKKLAQAIGADIFEIVPSKPYTARDLNWMDKNSRSSIEARDESMRPEIANKLKNINEYDKIYLGFPIWWYTAPKIVNTFLESIDSANKTIVLFATSGGSSLGKTIDDISKSCDASTKVISGAVLNPDQDVASLKQWAKKY